MRRFTSALAVGVFALVGTAAYAQKVYVYPQNGQTQEQQQKDEHECYQWAKDQSGVDPSQPGAGGGTSTGRGTVGGAAKGAAVGAAIGAIAGDAGKGAAIGAVGGGVGGRRGAKNSQAQAQQDSQSSYNRAFAVCMEGRGYSVK
jgi:hypothetical protein